MDGNSSERKRPQFWTGRFEENCGEGLKAKG
jgi:hypothetical protein